MRPLGLYLHIPFCKSKCGYCDFCSLPGVDEATVARYCAALEEEIRAYGREMGAYTVDTIYFGGGTPTYLSPERLSSLLWAVAGSFSVAEGAEITLECNPATADAVALKSLRAAGFNRLSLGAQSLNDGELSLLGRAHTAADFFRVFEAAREADFDNISADLMFGIPDQTAHTFHKSLSGLAALGPEHISAYGLILEEGTPFFERREHLSLPSEEAEREMYMHMVAFLEEAGYRRYEISNFSRAGRESRHNLKYWERRDYLGLGAAAHSCLGNERFANTADVAAYLSGERTAERERVDEKEALLEAVMLGMRLEKGICFESLAKTYGAAAWQYRDRLAKYEAGGFVRKTKDGYAFTSEGMYVSNTILSDVLAFE